ncbi:hypothetical protein Ndes2526A_g03620 [Nannochloris sp. 'desiccata']
MRQSKMEPPATFFASSTSHEVSVGGQSEEELLTALRKGSFLLKHGRQGRPKAHFFRLANCDNELRWRSASGAVKSVLLASVRDFLPGQATEVFRRHPVREPAASFSLRYLDSSGAARTLDLTCRDSEQYLLWYPGLQIAVQHSTAAAAAGLVVVSGTKSTVAGGGGGASPSRQVAAAAAGGSEHFLEQVVPGDLFIWGCVSNPSFNRSPTPPPPPSMQSNIKNETKECWPRRLTPTPIPLNSILDASTASVGRRHAAIVSAQGALYVLGEGSGGKLGRGHDNPAPVPHRTTRGLPGDGKIIAASCGDEYTAAITPEGQLYTWGRLPGESLPLVLPTLVKGGLNHISVCQVSCGPFHTAAVASDGRLFTWGEGFGGKLGHGDQINRLQPTHVVALRSMPVLQVACGVWHTAAIVLEPPGLGLQPPISPGGGVGGGNAFFGGGEAPATPPSPIHSLSTKPETNSHLLFLPSTPGRSTHHRRASSSISGAEQLYQGYQEGRGGSLYTWGGVNEAIAFGDSSNSSGGLGGGGGLQRRDSNKGCLGHGEIDLYTGQTVPTRVGGAGSQLTGKGVRSVAAGLHLTVALTTTGVVYQMGATGASGSTNSVLAPWEGATAPEPVKGQLLHHFVDAIACGMHHVVVLGRPMEKKVGRPIENSLPSVFTWGRGSEGQLGTGKWDDAPSPVVIEENLKGRRAVTVAAGGATTMVVCDHDLKKFEDVGLQSKEATDRATKTLLALLEPRTSTRPGSAAVAGKAGKSSRSGWLLTRDERPPSRSNIFRGSSSFSFTSAASGFNGVAGVGAGGGGGGGGSGQLNLSRLSSSTSMQSLGSGGGGGGGGGGIDSSYPSIISISGISTNSTVPSGVSGRNSLNYYQNEGKDGLRSTLSSSSSLSQSQSGIGKFDPWNNGVVRPTSPKIGNYSTTNTTPATSPGSIKGIGIINGTAGAAGGRFGGGSTASSLSAFPGAGSSSSSLQRDSQDVSLSKGRYIARLEQRLEALQRMTGGRAGGVEAAVAKIKHGDEKLKQAVAESAILFRESMKRDFRTITSSTTGIETTSNAAHGLVLAPHQPPPPPPSLILPDHAKTTTNSTFTPAPTPSNAAPDAAALEELLQRKQVELERQQQALALWAEELHRKEEALLQQNERQRSLTADGGGNGVSNSITYNNIRPAEGLDDVGSRAVASSAHSVSTTPVFMAGEGAGPNSTAASTPQHGSTAGDFSLHGEPAAFSVQQQHQDQEQQPQQQYEKEETTIGVGPTEEKVEGQVAIEHVEPENEEKEEEEWVEHLEQGVTATFIRDSTTNTPRLKRLRFSKTQFSATTASTWYKKNAANLTLPAGASSPGGAASTGVPHPPPSVGLSESVSTTPTKEVHTVLLGGGAGGTPGSTPRAAAVTARQMIAHGRVDSKNMSFDARELAHLHDQLHTYTVGSTAGAAPTMTPSFLSSPPVAEKEAGAAHQEFHTPLTQIVNEDKDKEESDGGTGGVRTRGTGIVPSPALESLFDKAAAAPASNEKEQEDHKEVNPVEEGTISDGESSSSGDVSLVSASSGGRRRMILPRGSKGNTNTTSATGNGSGQLSGVLLSPPPPRRPSPTRRPRSGNNNNNNNINITAGGARVRSFALTDVLSTTSLSPTTSARSLDVKRPGSQSPVTSTAAGVAALTRGGGGGDIGGSGLLRSVAAKIARSIIGGEDYTNISIPSPTASAASSTDQHEPPVPPQQQRRPLQQEGVKKPAMSPPLLVFGGRRPKSAG